MFVIEEMVSACLQFAWSHRVASFYLSSLLHMYMYQAETLQVPWFWQSELELQLNTPHSWLVWGVRFSCWVQTCGHECKMYPSASPARVLKGCAVEVSTDAG